MRHCRVAVLLILAFHLSSGLAAEVVLGASTPALVDGQPTVASITVKELKRTSEAVVLRELLVHEGGSLVQSQLRESLTRLRNLGIFSSVEAKILPVAANDDLQAVSIELVIEERWTTIPILKASSGGGVSQVIVGANDVNLFGRYIEAGAQYERLGATNSGVL